MVVDPNTGEVIEGVQGILNFMMEVKFEDVQSPDYLMSYGFSLQSWIAYTSQQVASTKKILHEARRKAMLNLTASLSANQANIGISLQKEYVNDLCAEENSAYILAERCNSACIHGLDFIRTCLATLRSEMFQSRNLNNTSS